MGGETIADVAVDVAVDVVDSGAVGLSSEAATTRGVVVAEAVGDGVLVGVAVCDGDGEGVSVGSGVGDHLGAATTVVAAKVGRAGSGAAAG